MSMHRYWTSGKNIFASEQGVLPRLSAAVVGVLDTMRELQAIFCAALNSYRRFQPNRFAPSRPDRGFDNRTATVRLPETKGKGVRLEHRISGAVVNPYLVLTAILGGILHGLDRDLDRPLPLEDPKAVPVSPLSHDWTTSVNLFEKSALAEELLGKYYRDIYVAVRRDEIAAVTPEISPTEYK
ncbi:MAG: hypothetical protein ACU0C9_07735 [Paracoccaceae bacterium]